VEEEIAMENVKKFKEGVLDTQPVKKLNEEKRRNNRQWTKQGSR